MSHFPTPIRSGPTPPDISCDLERCIKAAFLQKNFESENFKVFYKHAIADLNKIKKTLDKKRLRLIEQRLSKFQIKSLGFKKRLENLHTASVLLKNI